MKDETIFALSSGALPSGVAIIRLSGSQSRIVLQSLCGAVPPDRQACLRMVRNPRSGLVLDEALVLYFRGPNSFTGEDVAELHCHGGRATVSAVLDCLADQDGCRLAEAGEFSRRAFLNGRMDLTELEGLADLVSAETEQQRRLALRQSGGALRSLYENWRQELVYLRALIEASFDFSDEEDVSEDLAESVWPRVRILAESIRVHLDGLQDGEIVRDGFRVVLTGPPNAGKSTIFNGLLKRDAAIVTDVPGTTRDVLEARLDIDGFLVRVFDTAGIRDTSDAVERVGIERARNAAAEADLVLALYPEYAGLPPEARDAYPPVIPLRTFSTTNQVENGTAAIDARSEEGIEVVSDIISTRLAAIKTVDQPVPTRLRYREGLELCLVALKDSLSSEHPLEIRAEKLREASDSIGRLTGQVDVEDLLDVIFSQFCVGK